MYDVLNKVYRVSTDKISAKKITYTHNKTECKLYRVLTFLPHIRKTIFIWQYLVTYTEPKVSVNRTVRRHNEIVH